jgi:hypothetical protein
VTDAQVTVVASGFGFLEAPRWHEDRIWFSDFLHAPGALRPRGRL